MKSEALEEKEYTEKRFLREYTSKGISTFSREVISKGVRDGMRRARADYKWQGGIPPDGFNLDRNKKLLPNERNLLIRSIFVKYDEIENTAQIAFDQNKQGIKTKDGGKWTTLHIYRILTNPIYKGIYKSKETEVYVSEYQIIDTELFDRVQKKLKKRPIQKKMSIERKEAKVDEALELYFERLKTLEMPTDRVIEFKSEIDKESLFYPRENEPEITRIEKIRLRLLIYLEEMCKILEKETEILDKKATEGIRETTEKLDQLFKEMVSAHPEKRKIIEESLDDEREKLKQFAIERRMFLDDVVGDAR